MDKATFLLNLKSILDFIMGLLKVNIINIGALHISFWKLFSFGFLCWFSRHIMWTLLGYDKNEF